MATQTVEFRSPPSQTITAKLFAVGSDTQVDSVGTTEATNRKGTYAAAYTNVPAGEYELIALVSTTPVARWFVTLTLTTATFQVYDKSQTVLMVADVMNASALAADAVAEIQSGLATPTNITAITGNITGNLSGSVGSVTGAVGSVTGAVGSVIAAVTVGTINANVVNASALAADAVAEIQSGLATAANLLIVNDLASYCLTILCGATSTAGTASESYSRALNGETFTAAYTGLDATGNRSTTALSKV